MTHRLKIKQFVEGKFAVRFITALILINAVTLGLETDQSIMDKYGTILLTIDNIILSFFRY